MYLIIKQKVIIYNKNEEHNSNAISMFSGSNYAMGLMRMLCDLTKSRESKIALLKPEILIISHLVDKIATKFHIYVFVIELFNRTQGNVVRLDLK